MDEKALVQRAMREDKEAFAALYMRYRDALYRYALFRLGNDADAQDAVSACITAAYENIRSLRAEKAFGTWIFRILYRCCCTIVKERIADRDNASQEALDTIPAEDGSRISPELQEAFGVLEDEDREIVLLSVIAGYNSRELGILLHMKPATVRSRLARSLTKMRTFLSLADQ
jgi:RNA polymerase sigma-70 factor (ECF subfamily)